MRSSLTTCALVLLLSALVCAQARGGAGVSPSGAFRPPVIAPIVPPARGITISDARPHQPGMHHQGAPGAVFLGNPWFGSYEPVNVPTPTSPVVVVESPAATPPAPVEPSRPAEALLIELRGDHYVRVGPSEPAIAQAVVSSDSSQARKPQQKASIADQPPTVLVFRDGHREQLSDYSIIGSTIYASGDYWQSGSWTRRIALSTLDLPATIASNREAGVKFVLPSGPNVVVTRP